jgi:peroxiredoxin
MILERRLEKLKAERDTAVAAAEKKAKEKKTDDKDEKVEAKTDDKEEKKDEKKDEEKDDKKDDKKDKKKGENDVKKAISTAEKPFKARVVLMEKAIQELQGHEALIEDKYDDALALFAKSGSVETEFLVSVKLLAGKTDDAIKQARDHVKSHDQEVRPLSCLVETLWTADKKDECRESFEELRELAYQADIDVPALARLEPIAKELGFEADWRRTDIEPADDIGERPPLDSLGPFRWHPSAALDWTLVDAENKEISLSDYKGRPVIVIFYLGFGCLHCAEQLQAFAPMTKEFEKAGISLVAISTDGRKELTESWKSFDDASFPFPLVSDEAMEVFHQWRVFDDFEETPLHGTFLIDGDGLIRWHDISYEPFNNPKFVLGEAKRLLGQNSTRVVVSKRE